jgi:hypothetical protein
MMKESASEVGDTHHDMAVIRVVIVIEELVLNMDSMAVVKGQVFHTFSVSIFL